MEDLKVWMKKYGDLSGVVLNKNSDQIISGNQRSKVINLDDCEIDYVNLYSEPTGTGTIAEGYVVWEGERFSYREVEWTEKQEEEACIIANKAGGAFDQDLLSEYFQFEDLLMLGFSFDELDIAGKLDETDNPIQTEAEVIGRNIGEHHDYVVFLFENEVDYLKILDYFKIKKVVYKYSHKVKKKGVGRIILGEKLLEVIHDKDNN